MTNTGTAPLLDALTLGQKERIRGRFLRQGDAPGEPWYCVDCLADLPTDYFLHWDHRCEIAPATTIAPVPVTETFGQEGQQ